MSGMRVSDTNRPPKSPNRPFSSGPVMKELNRSLAMRYAPCLLPHVLVRGQGEGKGKAFANAFQRGFETAFQAACKRLGQGICKSLGPCTRRRGMELQNTTKCRPFSIT